ncbi:hypothetical protein M5E88_04605 [Akkermansia muciniphila]|nr:hypothetical protein M5E88_04605 [Akkermansia muciniphila]
MISGFLAALLSLDVFVDTLPRMEGCKSLPFVWGLENIPFLATSVMPTLFGIPQTISISKVIGADLFDIKLVEELFLCWLFWHCLTAGHR